MAMKFTIEMPEELIKNMMECEWAIRTKAGRKAVAKCGKIIAAAMRSGAPIGPTGDLARSMAVKTATYRKHHEYSVATAIIGPDKTVGSSSGTFKRGKFKGMPKYNLPYKYAHLVEFGHLTRNGRFIKQRGFGFMRNAFDSSLAAASDAIADSLRESLREVIGDLA